MQVHRARLRDSGTEVAVKEQVKDYVDGLVERAIWARRVIKAFPSDPEADRVGDEMLRRWKSDWTTRPLTRRS